MIIPVKMQTPSVPGVIVPVLKVKGLGQGVKQVSLAGAAATDQQQRIAGDKGRQDCQLLSLETIDPESF